MIGSVEGAAGWRSARSDNEENRSCGVGILQLLSPNQSKLVEILGKKTGWDPKVNKRNECASLGNEWASITGRYVHLSVIEFCISMRGILQSLTTSLFTVVMTRYNLMSYLIVHRIYK